MNRQRSTRVYLGKKYLVTYEWYVKLERNAAANLLCIRGHTETNYLQ